MCYSLVTQPNEMRDCIQGSLFIVHIDRINVFVENRAYQVQLREADLVRLR
jgi:hypothetical protein